MEHKYFNEFKRLMDLAEAANMLESVASERVFHLAAMDVLLQVIKEQSELLEIAEQLFMEDMEIRKQEKQKVKEEHQHVFKNIQTPCECGVTMIDFFEQERTQRVKTKLDGGQFETEPLANGGGVILFLVD